MAGETDWMYVVIRTQTCAVYQQQYGGTACRQGQVEGLMVPVFGPKGLSQLRELFEGHFRGAGTCNYTWQADEVERLREAVGGVGYWASDESGDGSASPLQLDEQQLREADEAWVPVRTPHGPGVLVWPNSG
jgi:Family of unknown function (DUF6210)